MELSYLKYFRRIERIIAPKPLSVKDRDNEKVEKPLFVDENKVN